MQAKITLNDITSSSNPYKTAESYSKSSNSSSTTKSSNTKASVSSSSSKSNVKVLIQSLIQLQSLRQVKVKHQLPNQVKQVLVLRNLPVTKLLKL